ncbi:homoserine dehydrogenase [Thermithiobacillus plumbiphilus]|uniref:Homoserine dehydrogenase n=1 Tax=Thermithiobacillus plumbiphilus TaxID=1729899 RepID=A0ABU9DBI1_9PROT
MASVKVGIIGLGTVGRGTLDVLRRNATEISRRIGRPLQVRQVVVRNPARLEGLDARDFDVVQDPFALVNDPGIDVVVELIGGIEPARSLVLAALHNGKHVVTANKALLALHGNEIFALAQEKGLVVAFEAAVAGGIPIIKAVREGLAGNRIEWLAGIINGTCNYILTQMRSKGCGFDTALAEAQALGYAEADPTFDIDGIDSAHKLTILGAIAYGVPLEFPAVHVEGIRSLQGIDVTYAEELGYRIKLLGIARRTAQGIEMRVHPTLVPAAHLLANVEGPFNAVLVEGDAVGQTLYHGRGAGAEPTASAVVADLVDVARTLTADPANRVPHLAFQPGQLASVPVLPMASVESAYYLRIQVLDKPGVLAQITRILADEEISIEAMIQKEAPDGAESVPVVLLTQRTLEGRMNRAISALESLPVVNHSIIRLRVETLTGSH